MMIRVGIPASFRHFSAVARGIGAPILVSANAFWRNGRFGLPTAAVFGGADVALDSAGFVAMLRYWGYQWSLGDYVDLAGRVRPSWWAAPDYCCEPEIASDRATVLDRVERTALKLDWCQQVAADRGVPAPMPVLQGWFPDDYRRCADLIGDLPSLVGIGSVCRRPLGGEAGVLNVIEQLDRYLPRHVRLHLFGVKGSAIAKLGGHSRVASVDSAAWDFAARRERVRNNQASCTLEYRSRYLRRWYEEQTEALGLFARAA